MIPEQSSLVRRAQQFGAEAHARQAYGAHPYTTHLSDVLAVLVRFGYTDDEDLLAATQLHDVLEDCDETFKGRLVIEFPKSVVALVKAVTNEPGKNRQERSKKTYPKIAAAGVKAIRLKLADRIANTESSKAEVPVLLVMYRNEYPKFRRVLYREGDADAMWEHLDAISASV